jgi:hypothetical protein
MQKIITVKGAGLEFRQGDEFICIDNEASDLTFFVWQDEDEYDALAGLFQSTTATPAQLESNESHAQVHTEHKGDAVRTARVHQCV